MIPWLPPPLDELSPSFSEQERGGTPR